MNHNQVDGSSPSWAELNAYVDGELDGDAAARVAAAVARDSRLAQEVARLASLKSAVQQSREPAPAGVMPPLRRHGRHRGLAACLAFLVLFGAVLAFGLQRGQETSAETAALSRAQQLHNSWLAQPARLEPPEAGLLLAALQHFGLPVQIPDLSDTRLQVAHVALSGPEQNVLHVGYLGTRGCRVSLLALRDQELPQRLQRVARDGGTAFLWDTGPVAYILLADGMEPKRMELIAEAIEQATRRLAPMPPETRTALADSRAHSQPCVG